LSCVGVLGFFLMGIFFLVQPRWFWTLISSPSFDANEMQKARSLQVERTQAYEAETHKLVPRGIVFHQLFNDRSRANLEEAKDALLHDMVLRRLLIGEFGQSLEDVNVVVVPAWEMFNDLNRDQIGLTPAAWVVARKTAGDPNVEGLTIADDSVVRTTYDGRPRVMITFNAFQSQKLLRLTLFHELLHALHVPAKKPPFFLIYQNDLAYLPFYRSYTSDANLDGSDELVPWLWVVVFVLSFAVALRAAQRNHLRLKALRSPSV
jgi:hypothetical protein